MAFIVARFRIYFPVNTFEGVKSALSRDTLLRNVYFIKCRQFISEFRSRYSYIKLGPLSNRDSYVKRPIPRPIAIQSSSL